MMWIRETRSRLSMEMELEAYRDECKWLLRCHHYIVNNCLEEYCLPKPLPILPYYAKILTGRWAIARKGILPPTLNMVLKGTTRVPVRWSPVLPHPEIPSCSLSLPCIEPESSGDDQTESDPLGVPVDESKEEQSEIPLAVEPDDITAKHRDGEQIPLES